MRYATSIRPVALAGLIPWRPSVLICESGGEMTSGMDRGRRWFASIWLFVVVLSALLLAGCQADHPTAVNCPDVGWTPVIAEVRDQFGRPAAVGATVRIESADGFRYENRGFGDSLRVRVGDPVTGVFRVSVTKPYHTGATAGGVEVLAAGPCGTPAGPARPRFVIVLDEDAPPVRQVITPPASMAFLDGNLTKVVTAKVQAAEGVSTEVFWVSRDTTVARVTSDGVLTSACRTSYGGTYVVASAVADPAVQDSISVGVWAAKPATGRCAPN